MNKKQLEKENRKSINEWDSYCLKLLENLMEDNKDILKRLKNS